MKENPARQTTLEIVKKAKQVKINQEKIQELARKWIKSGISLPVWQKEFHLQTENQETLLDYLIILDSINFCFWNKKQRWQINYQGKIYNGYFALALALKEFFGKNPVKGSLKYFSKVSFKEFASTLQGGKNLQFLKKRWQIARAVSSQIIKKYKNSQNFILLARGQASVLVPKIYQELLFFDDIANYQGRKVYFLKRAQILVSDIWGAFNAKGLGKFQDLDYLTAFADYRIPQILHNFGILEYSPALLEKIENRIIIPVGSKEEIEIRSCAIWAIEYLKKALVKLGKDFHSFQVDWILWNKSREIKIETPYHLTKTIFY